MKLIWAFAACAAALLLATSGAAAGDSGATVSQHVTFEGPVAINCGESLSEVVDVTGEATYVTIDRVNANDRYHLARIVNVRGSGVGLTTGAPYRVVITTADLGNEDMTHMDGRILLIGTGAAANYRWTEQFHVQTNALGETVVFKVNGDGVCR